ncbi:MAG: DUF4430 domain-containing protein [Clostridia bacterium]|nr:DUF4430 domain-containing protein [Clostridia bacterium]
MKKSLSAILSILLIISTLFIMTACGDNNATNGNADTTAADTTAQQTVTAPPGSKIVGEGETNFVFSVVDLEGNETYFDVYTNKTTVGDALSELELIKGEEGDYGLYVKTVNGITLDYDKDGKYWAFYIDGEYAQTGVDATDIVACTAYSFKAE